MDKGPWTIETEDPLAVTNIESRSSCGCWTREICISGVWYKERVPCAEHKDR